MLICMEQSPKLCQCRFHFYDSYFFAVPPPKGESYLCTSDTVFDGWLDGWTRRMSADLRSNANGVQQIDHDDVLQKMLNV